MNVLTAASLVGIFLNLIVLISYIMIFSHIVHHNNNVAATVLQTEVIQRRNRSAAISMLGLMLCWLLDVLYITSTGLLFTLYNSQRLREFSSLLKVAEFLLIPWIQILTSPPIRRFKMETATKID